MMVARGHAGLLENWMYPGVCAAGVRSNKLEFVELLDLGDESFYRRLKMEKAAPYSCKG